MSIDTLFSEENICDFENDDKVRQALMEYDSTTGALPLSELYFREISQYRNRPGS